MKLKVSGSFKLTSNFEINLDMTSEEFEALNQREQDELMENHINWYKVLRSVDFIEFSDDIDWKEVSNE